MYVLFEADVFGCVFESFGSDLVKVEEGGRFGERDACFDLYKTVLAHQSAEGGCLCKLQLEL